MKIKKGLSIILTTAMVLQTVPVFAGNVNKSSTNKQPSSISETANKKRVNTKDKSVAEIIGESTSNKGLEISEVRETLKLEAKSHIMNTIPVVNGKNTSEILKTEEKLNDIEREKIEKKDKQSKTTSIIAIQDSMVYIKNGKYAKFVDGVLQTTNIKTGTTLSYEDILRFEKTLDTDKPITEISYMIKESDGFVDLKPGDTVKVVDGLTIMRYCIINEDEDSDNKDEPIKPYNPEKDPTNNNGKVEKLPEKSISMGDRNYSLKSTEEYIKYLENLDKENQKKIKKLTKKEKDKLNEKTGKGMKTFKGYEYYDNGDYKDVIAQKNLIVSMVNLLKTKVGILSESQIEFLGKKIDESKIMLKDNNANMDKVNKYKEAFNKIRVFIEENSNVENTDFGKISRDPIQPGNLGLRSSL